MRSKLRSCQISRWLAFAACTLTITGSLFSCTISANAGTQKQPEPVFRQAIVIPW
jgi:hypothetical protein